MITQCGDTQALCQKQVSRAGTNDYIPQILWDVIIGPFPWYLLLAQLSPYIYKHLCAIQNENTITLYPFISHSPSDHLNRHQTQVPYQPETLRTGAITSDTNRRLMSTACRSSTPIITHFAWYPHNAVYIHYGPRRTGDKTGMAPSSN